MRDSNQRANRMPSSKRNAPALSIFVILLLVSILTACKDETLDPSTSPLVFVSPIAATDAQQYPHIQFILSEATIGLVGTMTIESELRIVGSETTTQTQTIDVTLPIVNETTKGDGFYIIRWAMVEIGEEWIRATLRVVESDSTDHVFYSRMYVAYGELARSDDRGFYYHRAVEPYVLWFPIYD